MKSCDKPYVITISHQIGSGGALIGQKLSERLGIPLIDHQILQQVSQQPGHFHRALLPVRPARPLLPFSPAGAC